MGEKKEPKRGTRETEKRQELQENKVVAESSNDAGETSSTD